MMPTLQTLPSFPKHATLLLSFKQARILSPASSTHIPSFPRLLSPHYVGVHRPSGSGCPTAAASPGATSCAPTAAGGGATLCGWRQQRQHLGEFTGFSVYTPLHASESHASEFTASRSLSCSRQWALWSLQDAPLGPVPALARSLTAAAAALLLAGMPAVLPPPAAAELSTITAQQATEMAKPLKQQKVNKGRIWALFVLGATALFGTTGEDGGRALPVQSCSAGLEQKSGQNMHLPWHQVWLTGYHHPTHT